MVGTNIKEARRKRGWTQVQLAHAIGHQGGEAASAAISKIESGQRDPRASTLDRVAKALGIKVMDLLRE